MGVKKVDSRPAEPRRTGPPRIHATHPLDDPRHELFVVAYLRNGWNRAVAYTHAYGIEKKKAAQNGANRLLHRSDVQDRLRYLLNEQALNRVTQEAIHKDAIDGRMWSVAERCLQHQKLETPEHLRSRAFTPCASCKNKRPMERCASCKANRKLIEDWTEFGGIYRFDSGGAVKALLPLGRDRGLYIDKKLVGHMEGDEIIDAMNDKEIRDLVRSLATQVGLRIVEAGSEGASSTSAKPGPHLQSVS